MMATEVVNPSIEYYIYFDNPPAWYGCGISEWRNEISSVMRNTQDFFYIVRYKNEKMIEILDRYMED